MHGIMLVNNKAYCPKTNLKPNGLIKLFKKLNDSTYVDFCLRDINLYETMTFDAFNEQFIAPALSHYELSLRTKELPYKSNVVQEQEQKEKEYYRRRGDIMKGEMQWTWNPCLLSFRDPSLCLL